MTDWSGLSAWMRCVIQTGLVVMQLTSLYVTVATSADPENSSRWLYQLDRELAELSRGKSLPDASYVLLGFRKYSAELGEFTRERDADTLEGLYREWLSDGRVAVVHRLIRGLEEVRGDRRYVGTASVRAFEGIVSEILAILDQLRNEASMAGLRPLQGARVLARLIQPASLATNLLADIDAQISALTLKLDEQRREADVLRRAIRERLAGASEETLPADLQERMAQFPPDTRESLEEFWQQEVEKLRVERKKQSVGTKQLQAGGQVRKGQGETRAEEQSPAPGTPGPVSTVVRYAISGRIVDANSGLAVLWGTATPIDSAAVQFLRESHILVVNPLPTPALQAGWRGELYQGVHCFIERRLGPVWVYGDCPERKAEEECATQTVGKPMAEFYLCMERRHPERGREYRSHLQVDAMRDELLAFAKAMDVDDVRRAWFRSTLFWSGPSRIRGFYKAYKTSPEAFAETIRQGRYPAGVD